MLMDPHPSMQVSIMQSDDGNRKHGKGCESNFTYNVYLKQFLHNHRQICIQLDSQLNLIYH